jgi:hypothetical protein
MLSNGSAAARKRTGGPLLARVPARPRLPSAMSIVPILDAAPTRPQNARRPPEQVPAVRSARLAWLRARLLSCGPLGLVLAVQCTLSLRLVWSATAFQDEALYLRAGHLEWAHWLHGASIPAFTAYFSGAPVIYPPLGAIADSVGGLAAARLLSLVFMLATTGLLWATVRRLYGLRAALLAAGLFATMAGTQFLGAFATYDAMALSLLALSAWLAVRSADCRRGAQIALLVLAGSALAVADAVKYSTALFTPVVVVLTGAAMWRRERGWITAAAILTVLGSWLALVIAAVKAGGAAYWQGITTSTLDRVPSHTAAALVLQRAYVWTSLILVLAVLGVVLAIRSKERARFLPAALLAAAVLAPIEQARLHTTVSLQKHVVFGAWFAAIAAGYALARLSRVDTGRGWAPVMAIPIVASTLFSSLGQASALFRAWPDASAAIGVLRSAARTHPGHYLAEDYDVEAYYLRGQAGWRRWSNTYYYRYPGELPGAASYAAAVGHDYFALVILDFGDTAVVDRTIVADIAHSGGYYLLARAGQFTIWAARRSSLPAVPGAGP